jgi:hypothetical protein
MTNGLAILGGYLILLAMLVALALLLLRRTPREREPRQ